jgi:hypothetical protein
MMIPIVRLSERERDDYLRRSLLRPPDTAASGVADSSESEVAVLAAQLQNVATIDPSKLAPYFIPPIAAPNDRLRVEISEPGLLTPRLIAEVCAVAQRLPGGQGIEICDALGCLETPFNVFVERDVIYAWSSDDPALQALGLKGEHFQC